MVSYDTFMKNKSDMIIIGKPAPEALTQSSQRIHYQCFQFVFSGIDVDGSKEDTRSCNREVMYSECAIPPVSRMASTLP